jgi:dynein heavy chain
MGRRLQCCREFIKALPATETPEVFGMHENANIAFEVQETHRVLDTILAMQPRLATLPGSTTPDQQVAAIAASILDKLPPILSMAEAAPGVFERTPAGQLNSLAVVLGQEMERFNRLSAVMSSSLEELQKALQGLVVMSGELELMSTSLLNSQVNTVTAVVCDLYKHVRCLQMSHLF